ncbi:MAG TPA: CPBP family intramembrane glutamic endopeptidase [Gemmataceae bacterium]|jgi:membrane protease YdiL (CAAX protease family)|nr:CPBP family intramembrane glutamic endopeptidase [Gemmataceae bacterium]
MFGMAHVGVPLSIPLLMVVGLFLGYVRTASRSLLLPMLMHFGHNAAILLLGSMP